MTPFTGGRTLMFASAGVGVVCTALTGVGHHFHPALAASSWLVAFVYWAGLAMASLFWVALFDAAAAKWFTVLRRQLEHHASALVVCAAAFIGVALGLEHLYVWADEHVIETLPEAARRLLQHRRPYLNAPGFIMRGAIVLALFVGVWLLLDRASRRRETTRGLSAGALFSLALGLAVAAVDWLMSLEPEWFSASFCVYGVAGSLASAAAMLLLVVIVPVDPTLPAAKASNEHVAHLAAVLFVCTCLWGWVAGTQWLVTSRANLPAEVSWLQARTSPTWFPVTALLGVGRFALPFIALLSRAARRNRNLLTALSVWVLAMQFVDVFWVVKPALRLRSAALTLPAATFGWSDLTAWLGLGGLCMAYVLFRMRGPSAAATRG
ncbi:MAG: hypothetical protein JNK82_06380 [Myxococcaceae bacterium]|nr:hypothetical protein [Myxococcaceae bacterium]